MKYVLEERLNIGRRIYEGEINRYEAASEYGISSETARGYMRLYRAEYQLPPKNAGSKADRSKEPTQRPTQRPNHLEDYESMSKEELISELVRAKIDEARLKKGYMVKGVGARKEYIPLGRKSTK